MSDTAAASATVTGVSRIACCVRPCVAVGVTACLSIGTAFAAVPTVQVPTSTDDYASSADEGAFGFLRSISRTNYLLGDMWGVRPFLSRYGLSLGLQETSEVLGNVSGGIRKGFDYDGLSQAVVQLDTQRAFGLYGGTVNASALQVHGRNLSADNLGSLQTSSGIVGDRAARLWELWYQQKFLPEDRLDIKIGQQSLDQEFMVSQNANYFVNTMFGWPMVPSADLPGGGPAYPLSALGIRFRARPVDPITILAGVFNGSPSKSNDGDSQQNNAHGTSFPLNGGMLAIAEIQYAYPSIGAMERPGESEPLACLYKIGVWYDSERFADERLDNAGLSQADPDTTGTAATHHGDYAFYGVADQMLWHSEDDSDRNINLFVRAMGTPENDRNLVTFSLNVGLLMHEPILHRDDDVFGIGMGYAKVSVDAATLDRDTAYFTESAYPVRSSETFFEATYQYELTPWCMVQPDVQYVIHPGGGIQNPDNPGQDIHNELVVGVRTNILF